MDGEPLHILVVDDPSEHRATVCEHVGLLGYRCDAVANGVEALSVLDWYRPLVVVIEWSLLDGTGIGLSTKVHHWAVTRFRPLLVILLSHVEETDDVRRVEHYDHYIHKSVPLCELERAIVAFMPPA